MATRSGQLPLPLLRSRPQKRARPIAPQPRTRADKAAMERVPRRRAQWPNIKSDMHDDMYLALYTPSGVFIYKHDGTTGVSSNGKAQEAAGTIVQVYGPRPEKVCGKV